MISDKFTGILINMIFLSPPRSSIIVYPVIVIVMMAAVICGMPNVDPMHRIAQGCSMLNFLSALPLQNQNWIFFSFLPFVLLSLVFPYPQSIAKSAVKNNAAPSGSFSIRALIPKIFDYLTKAFSQGIIHPKIYSVAFSV